MDTEIIPNGLDTGLFHPHDTADGYDYFDLDSSESYILFGADYATDRKGGDLLRTSLRHLQNRENINLLTFGGVETVADLQLPVIHLGWLSDNELSLAYSTADVMSVPSRQEAFGQTASEAMAAGTPTVAFDTSGLRDIIDHKQTGYLAEPFNTYDFAEGIKWVLDESNKKTESRAREIAERRFSKETISRQYYDLYDKVK